MKKIDLNKLRDKAYKTAYEHGFHDQELSNEHFLCLVISELMEAVEANRKGKLAKVPVNKKDTIFDKRTFHNGNKYFAENFEKYIKDTVEDELADATICLLDLAGLRGIAINFSEKNIYESTESCNDESFTESIYAISTIPIKYEYEYNYSFDKQLNSMLLGVIGLSNYIGIDLLWHIEQKMKYNELREKYTERSTNPQNK